MNCGMKRAEAEALADWALSEALRGGAWGADVLYSEGSGSDLSLLDGEVEECNDCFSAGLGVRTIMPAVLIEMGYLTDPTESHRLTTAEYRETLCRSFAQGIVQYIKDHPVVR